MRRGKKYKNVIQNRKEEYSLIDGLDAVKSLSTSKFPSKIECHISLNLNTKNNNQIIRGNVVYKHKIGNDKNILVLIDKIPEGLKEDKNIKIGLNEYIEKIKNNWLDFDILITTPEIMPQVTSLGNILGPKSLMPNIKNGTITNNIQKTVNEYKKGKIDFKSDQTNTIHTIIGSVNNTKEELLDNIIALMKAISSTTGKPLISIINSIYIAPTIGPSIKINKKEISDINL